MRERELAPRASRASDYRFSPIIASLARRDANERDGAMSNERPRRENYELLRAAASSSFSLRRAKLEQRRDRKGLQKGVCDNFRAVSRESDYGCLVSTGI